MSAPIGSLSAAFALGERRAASAKDSPPMMLGDLMPGLDADMLRETFGEVTDLQEAAYRDGFNGARRSRR